MIIHNASRQPELYIAPIPVWFHGEPDISHSLLIELIWSREIKHSESSVQPDLPNHYEIIKAGCFTTGGKHLIQGG